ncbi:hypothetical protein E4U09_006304 [Claviceps aff. purpurea]|uniref:Uncharacterized protein n=1 Tax=Claviceps aff. purpurea TaxID=1967640 RepID=A0A9P7U165_9HYPO|nr:hypothetical protein E4U09_006304 [Claviceps aff. purpurea]
MNLSRMQSVDRFCHQYFQLESHLDFPDATCLRLEQVQNELYGRMFSRKSLEFGPPVRYRVKTLKELSHRIESAIDDWEEHGVSDDIMSTLSSLMAAPIPSEATSAQQKCFVTYHLSLLENLSISSDQAETSALRPSITLLENRSLIAAGGTTGLRTWEAALHMGQYLCQNLAVVAGKHVLELGAGTGYLSILCVKHLQATHAVASDGSDDVVNNFSENLSLNGLRTSSVTPMNIAWGQALVEHEGFSCSTRQPVDVVLGADITYDRRVIPALITTLLDLFALYSDVQVYISVTERNADTYQVFLDLCSQSNLIVENLQFSIPPVSQQNGPFYNDNVAIKLCRVARI